MDDVLTDDEMHERMANGWREGRPFTVCGNGSLMHATENIRRVLPLWCARYDIESVCDAGAGDLKWREGMRWGIDYTAYDLIPRHPKVERWDITTEPLPQVDLILCRMVLNHIQPRVPQTLALFKQSATYLAATQYQGDNLPQRSKQFYRLDLRQWLGEPIEAVQDGPESFGQLALWRLTDVR